MISKLRLKNFRGFAEKELVLDKKTLVMGNNGVGKTNILEAIFLGATGKSFRADREMEMVKYNSQFSILNYHVNQDSLNMDLQITLTDGTLGIIRKKFEMNGVPKRMIDFVGQMRAVLFRPEDINILAGSPSGRRKYLDFVIMQVDREYRRSLMVYEKGVRQRNKVLERIREGFSTRSQLVYWDHLLIKNGEIITRAREEYLNYLNERPDNLLYRVEYDRSTISPARILQYEIEEVAAATTLVGPHRDDFKVVAKLPNSNSNEEYKDVAKFGSRGEQRMAILWLKMGELNFLSPFAKATEDAQRPILLLDDVFSELDHGHRDRVLEIIEEHVIRGGQVVMTTADPHMMPEDGWSIIRLN